MEALRFRRSKELFSTFVVRHPQEAATAVEKSPAPKDPGMEWAFELFVDTRTIGGEQAAVTLQRFCEKFLEQGRYEVAVYDLTKDREAFVLREIVATPTLIVRSGAAVRRFVGNFHTVELFQFCLMPQGLRMDAK